MKKKLLSLLLSIVMVLSLMPTVAFAADEPIPITSVTVQGYESPVAGKTAGELCNLTLPEGANYTMDPNYFSEGRTCWYHLSGSTGSPMGKNDVFVNGEEYSFSVPLKAKEGYYFDKNCTYKLLDAENNEIGISVQCDDEFGPGVAIIVTEPKTLTASGTPIKITEVEITNVPTPVVDASTDTSGITVTTVPADAADVLTIRWYNKTDDFTEDSTFKAGKEYVLGIHFQPKDGYYFEFEDKTGDEYYTGEATFNGEEPDIAWSAHSDVTHAYTDLYTHCKPITPTDIGEPPLQTPITKVEVTNVPTPVVGEPTDVSGIIITTVPADAYANADIYWWNDTDRTSTDTEFKAGKEYYLCVKLSPKDGCYFEFDETVAENYTGEATFNGEAADTAWSLDFGSSDLGMYSKHMKPVALEKITKVEVTNVPTPVVGASTAISADDVTITTEPAGAATINEIYWNTYDETFQAGKSYGLIVRFAPKPGYYFEFEDETGVGYYIGDVTFNGQPAFSAYETGSVPGELFATSQSMTTTEAPTTYTVTFNMNGHGTQVAAETVNEGAKATKPADPTEEGWTFGGWYADATFNAAFDFTAPITADTTVHAKWTENTVPATPENPTITSVEVTPNVITIPRDPQQLITEQQFTATVRGTGSFSDEVTWSITGGDLGTAIDSTGLLFVVKNNPENTIIVKATSVADPTKYGTATVTLTSVNTYTVSFEMNGHGAQILAQSVESGSKAIKPADPTTEGWTFGGWYKDSACTETQKYDFNTPVTANLTLYAKWTEDTNPPTPPVPVTHTVSFNMNGHGAQISAQPVESGSKATKPADPTAEGWTFDGWYADATFSTKFDFNTAINANTTIYAKWTKNSVTPTDPTNPQTGDNSNMFLWIALLLVSGGALVGTTVYGKKRKRAE